MENEQSETLTKVILSVILIAFLMFAMVIVIGALNTSNLSTGTQYSGNNSITYYNVTIIPNTLTTPLNSYCSVVSVTNQTGGTLNPSNYSVNNCVITYNL